MNEVVKYNNNMNKIPLKNFTQRDLNFFFTICTQVKDSNTDLIEIPFYKIKELSNYQQTDRATFVAELTRMNEKLNKISGTIHTEEEIISFNLFSTFRILKTKDIVKVRVNSDFVHFFKDVANMFTRFELAEYVLLESIYAKALFRLLKQWRKNGCTQEYSVKDLKFLLDTPDYAPKHLKDSVLNPAIKEINEKGFFKNLYVEVNKEKKRGAPVRGYIFHFDKENGPQETSITEPSKPKSGSKKASTKTPTKQNFVHKNAFTGYSSQRQYENLNRIAELRQKQDFGLLTDEEYAELDRLSKSFI